MSRTDEAIVKIKEMIVSGDLQPGDRLPRENDLAQHLGLSRNSLREAVRALEVINILDVRQGDGTYVTSLAPELLLDAVTFVVDFHRDDRVLQFLEVRRILEPAATALAAARIAAEEVDALSALVDEITPQTPVEERVERDVEFHRRIANASGNVVLAGLIESLTGHTTRARRWRGLTEQDAYEHTVSEHRAICAALRAGDVELARSWAAVHVAGVERWLRNAL
jgi:GntR family transcriptional regulator, transcriptional repressor for pyruvate dehydrogenase complex